MKIAKKTLYIISGIIKVAVGGFGLLIGLLLLLLKSVIQGMFDANPEALNEMINGLTEMEEYAYLKDSTKDEQMDFVFGVLSKFALVLILITIAWVVIAIFLFILAKRISADDFQKKMSITLTVLSWVVSMFTISTILTTIATCLHRRKGKSKGKEKHEEIEAYQE